jgi:hypothetical protein
VKTGLEGFFSLPHNPETCDHYFKGPRQDTSNIPAWRPTARGLNTIGAQGQIPTVDAAFLPIGIVWPWNFCQNFPL